jgi:hypothetical protein
MKINANNIDLEREIKKKTISDASNSKSTKKRKRNAYTNLLAPHLWPLILATRKKMVIT